MSTVKQLKIFDNGEFLPDEKLRLWLKDYLAANKNLNTNIISRSDHTGVSRTALDAYLEGTYFIPKSQGGKFLEDPKNSDVENKIRAYKERVVGTERHGYTNEFVHTQSWAQFKYACRTAIDEGVIVVIYF